MGDEGKAFIRRSGGKPLPDRRAEQTSIGESGGPPKRDCTLAELLKGAGGLPLPRPPALSRGLPHTSQTFF